MFRNCCIYVTCPLRLENRPKGVPLLLEAKNGRSDPEGVDARYAKRHEDVFGAVPERDITLWFSDASALTRYGIPTVNYGTSTGLMDVEKGENLEIDGLVKTAETYAKVAMRICGLA